MKTLALGYAIMVIAWITPVIVLLAVTGLDATTAATAPAASKDDTCYAVELEKSFLDEVSKIYDGSSTQWIGGVPEIWACPAHRIRQAHEGAEGLYSGGIVLVSIESGVLDKDGYGLSLVAHELAHYLQDKSGILGTVPTCEAEDQAYRIQKEYLDSVVSEWEIDISESECAAAVEDLV